MKLKNISSNIMILLVAAITLYLGKTFTEGGMQWYRTLNLPLITPPDIAFMIAWNIIYLCTISALLIIWNNHNQSPHFKKIISLFAFNAFLNAFWSYLFFTRHLIDIAFFEAIILQMTVFALMWYLWKTYKPVTILLLPYALWMFLALYLNYTIWILN